MPLSQPSAYHVPSVFMCDDRLHHIGHHPVRTYSREAPRPSIQEHTRSGCLSQVSEA